MRRYPAIEFTWATRPDDEALDRLTARLDDGSMVAIDDQERVRRVFFDSAEARDRALASLERRGPWITVRAADIDDDDWAERSQAAIGAIRVGRIVVAPPWQSTGDRAAEAGVDHVIVINPSMGFGTGHHASTRRCLSLLQTIAVGGCSVVDVGTGSGVLAIAAWRLGAAAIDAIDMDPDALASARDSLQRNGATGAIRLVDADLSGLASSRPVTRYDVLVANLTGATLERHASALTRLAHEGSSLIAGGLEAHEADAVRDALGRHGWQLVGRDAEDGWTGLLFVRTATTPTASTGN